MAADRRGALLALLAQTEAAHGAYEATTLAGVYDEAWPRWYAEYAVEHGIGGLVGIDLTADRLSAFFERIWADYQRTDPKPTDTWAVYTANRIIADL
jgi:hypothetical protein